MTIAAPEEYRLSDAKNRLSALTARANATGHPFIILKNGKPWAEVRPLSKQRNEDAPIRIKPLKREVPIADIDALFESYDGDFVAKEDGFANPVGSEEM